MRVTAKGKAPPAYFRAPAASLYGVCGQNIGLNEFVSNAMMAFNGAPGRGYRQTDSPRICRRAYPSDGRPAS